MPKTDIDYSSTIIYKITCKDPLIKDLYVGHTTNFVQKKNYHKQSCINEKNNKLYETIRNNGNWENWKMEIIDFFECKNHYEAIKKEEEYFISLNATLNSIDSYSVKKSKEIKSVKQSFNCTNCNMVFSNENTLELHNKTKKHLKNKEKTGQEQSILFKYNCDICNYNTIRKSQYERHIGTSKHQALVKNNMKDELKCSNCNKTYMDRSGLWKHKKKCKLVEENEIESDNATLKSLLLDVIKSNNELQKENQNFQLHI
jgi:transposase-like protein